MEVIVHPNVQRLNQIHFVWVSISLSFLLWGQLTGQFSDMNMYEVTGRSTPALALANLVLIGYSLWSFIDIYVYSDKIPKSVTTLNLVHHSIRVFMTMYLYFAQIDNYANVLGFYLYCSQCMFLYARHGWLYQGGKVFRFFLRHLFRLSVVWRAVNFPYVAWVNAQGRTSMYAAFGILTLFDYAYVTFHVFFAEKPKKEGKEKTP
eukprot:TRINITY_DN6491_c0_g1_i1.p1 TRINITY_DN6491_c0_g1~~TRINITY_DN6491_c0_g1_i1.p1  ORF type:complete len:205 (-),score=21.80 TRINITY_DN6491_c0_g1_i1:50-664(-)